MFEEKMKLMGLCPNESPCGETGYLQCVKKEVGQYTHIPHNPLSSNVYDEIKTERKVQDEQWGGPKHDDMHSPNDWIVYIVKQLGKASSSVFRYQMIKIAALAVAAVEWIDRRQLETIEEESAPPMSDAADVNMFVRKEK